MPTSVRYQWPGSWIIPPANAAGIDVAQSGTSGRQRTRFARRSRSVASDATSTLSVSAVGRMTAGGNPNNAIAAR